MIRLLQWLFTGHCHKWTIIEKRDVFNQDKQRIGIHYYLQCEYCGITKREDCV